MEISATQWATRLRRTIVALQYKLDIMLVLRDDAWSMHCVHRVDFWTVYFTQQIWTSCHCHQVA